MISKKNLVSLQQSGNTPNGKLFSRHSINEQNVQFTDEIPTRNLNDNNAVFHIEKFLVYIDMMNMKSNKDHVLFIAGNFRQTNVDYMFELNRNQYSAEIKRIIESHDAKWISYQPERNQNSNPLDTDHHTITSIERI